MQASGNQHAQRMKRPNILQIIWHDLGAHLSCYGAGSVCSPCIDRMADEGVLFERHFSTGSVCVPSRCSILTGRYPHAHRLWCCDADQTAFPALLRQAGYETYRAGFREEGEFYPRTENFDRGQYARDVIGYSNSFERSDDSDVIADQVLRFLDGYAGDAPYYFCAAFSDVHRPNEVPVTEEEIERTCIPRALPHMPDTFASREDVAMLEKRIRRADAAVGRILERLRRSGKEDTIVFFTTDHGLDLPRAKQTLYDAGIHTALIFWGSGCAQGVRNRGLHSHVDIFPTLLELCGLPAPGTVQGESFAAAVKGDPEQGRSYVLAERAWEARMEPVRALRTKRYKYIRNYCPGFPIPLPPDYVKKVGAEQMLGRYDTPRPYEELYDLNSDPYELQNRAEDPALIQIKAALAAELDAILTRDGDPVRSTHEYLSFLREHAHGRWTRSGGRWVYRP